MTTLPPTPVLGTERLELRPLAASDAPAMFVVHSDPEAMRYWSRPAMTDPAEAEAAVARTLGFVAAGDACAWVVCEREGALVGSINLFRFDAQNARAEIGYILGRAWWGRGYMQEALGAVIAWAFGTLDLRRIEADTDPRNAGSLKLLERLGFAREGLLRERWVVADEVSDSLLFGLLRSEWVARTRS